MVCLFLGGGHDCWEQFCPGDLLADETQAFKATEFLETGVKKSAPAHRL